MSLAARALFTGPSPTGDLYLGYSCAAEIEAGEIERLAPTVFRSGESIVVLRHPGGVVLPKDAGRLIYVVDDDAAAGIRDAGVPPAYRAKLAAIEARSARRLIPKADLVLAASDRLAETLAPLARKVGRIDPAWPLPPTPQPRENGATAEVALMSAKSHAADFRWIAPVLNDLLQARASRRLTVSANLPVPRDWHAHGAVEVVPAMDWADYRAWMAGRRFDIALYPLRPGGLNAARSSNKLGEYAQFGAAILTSESWAPGAAAAAAGRCRAIPDDPVAWAEALALLIDDPSAALRLARINAAALAAEDAPATQRALWRRLLSLGP